MKRVTVAAGALLSLLVAGVVAAQSSPCLARSPRSLIVDPSNSSVLYTTGNGGLFGSGNGGSAWRLLYSGVSKALTVDPLDSEHLLLSSGKSLIESRDGGQNWKELTVPPLPGGFIALVNLGGVAIDPLGGSLYTIGEYRPFNGILYRNYLYKSIDGGQSWTPVLNALGMTAPVFDPFSTGRLLIGVNGGAFTPDYSSSFAEGILMSQDGGLTWSTNLAISTSGLSGGSLVADPTDPKTLYAKVACDTYESFDGGSNWVVFPIRNDCSVQDLMAGPSEVFANGLRGILKSRPGSLSWEPFLPVGNTLLAVDPSNGDALYVENGGALLKSIDGGKTFSLLCEAPERPDIGRSGPRGSARPVGDRK